MTITIRNWRTNAIIHESAKSVMAEALAEAIAASADLADAYLANAYLADADLTGANLAGADLADADLAGADLANADLTGANLANAYLANADLTGANLAGAYLVRADLADADLAGADLAGARGVERDGQGLFGRSPLDAPVIPRIHQTLLEAVTRQGCTLDMRQWHQCETTHCRAGWIVTLAGEAGKALEDKIGTARAAAAIYHASDPAFRIPHWYAQTDRAMADIKRCAAEEAAKEVTP